MIEVQTGSDFNLSLLLDDGAINKYPLAYVYDLDGVLVTSLDMDHASNGLYISDTYVFASGYFNIVFVIYSDAGHTLEDVLYSRSSELVFSRSNVISYEIGLNCSYDSASDILYMDAWIESDGLLISNPVSVSVEFFETTGASKFIVTSSTHVSGVFKLQKSAPTFVKDRVYHVRVTIVTGSVTIIRDKDVMAYD